MKYLYSLFLISFFIITCKSQQKNESEVFYNSLENTTYINKNIPKFSFKIPKKWNNITIIGTKEKVNNHYIGLKNANSTEIEVGIFKMDNKIENDHSITNESFFIKNFELFISWLKSERYIFSEAKSDNNSYYISSIKNNKLERSVLFGIKNKKRYCIMVFDNQMNNNQKADFLIKTFNEIKL